MASSGDTNAGPADAYDTSGTSPPFSTKLIARLYHANRLVPVPLRPGEKKPAILGHSQLTHAKVAPLVAAWSAGQGVGLLVGEQTRLAVVDVDTKNGGDPIPFLGTTDVVARTPSGGYHFYYLRDEPTPSRIGARPGVDLLADGGRYVGAWPTALPNGAYQFQPKALAILLGRGPGLTPFSSVRHLFATREGSTTNGHDKDPDAKWITRLWQHGAPKGEQRQALTRLAGYYAKHKQPADATAVQLWTLVTTKFKQRPNDPWTEAQVRELVASIYAAEAATKPTRVKLAFRDLTDLIADAAKEPDVPWTWNGYLAPGVFSVLFGKPKIGKSTLVFGLLRALQSGEPFLDQAVRSTSVVYLSEEPLKSLAQKAAGFGIASGQAYLVTRKDGFSTRTFREAMLDAADHAAAISATQVIVDTVNFWGRLAKDEEQDAGVMTELSRVCQEVAARGIGVLALHHSKKGNEIGTDAMRGSGALAANADICVQFREPHAGQPERELHAWGRYDETPVGLRLTYDRDRRVYRVLGEIGRGPDGQRRRVLAALPEEPPGASAAEVAKQLGLKSADRVRGILQDASIAGEVFVTEPPKGISRRKGGAARYYRDLGACL